MHCFFEATMATKTTDTTDVLRRRVRLIALLQQRGGLSRFVAAEQLGCDPRTIQRDLAWLAEHGVPVTSEQPSATVPSVWTVPRRWAGAAWLWRLMSAGD